MSKEQIEIQEEQCSEEHQCAEEQQCGAICSAAAALPSWVWGATAFVAGYMMLQMQGGA